MEYDHVIESSENLENKNFHLSCGYYTKTAFFFEKANFAVVIDCSGEFIFYNAEGEKIETIKAKSMTGGRGCYMDILITTTEDGVIFRLPDYSWWDHYPDCDGESDRWDADIIGINDEVVYPNSK